MAASLTPHPPLRGIYVPTPTFFTTSNSAAPVLDLPTQLSYSLHLLRSGITGLVLLGSTGEAVHLTSSERFQLVSYIRKGLDDAGFHDSPLIVGTASGSVEDTVTQLKEAKEAGAKYGLCLMMGYFAGSVVADGFGEEGRGVEEWWRAVADATPIPILLYHYPAVSNNLQVPLAVFQRLSEHANIVGAKFSHGDIAAHSAVTLHPSIDHSLFNVYTGLGQQLLSVLLVDGAGAIDGLAAVCPREVVGLYNLGVQLFSDGGNAELLKKARRLQWAVARAEELVVKQGAVGVKEALRRQGFGTGEVRRPLVGFRIGQGEKVEVAEEAEKRWQKWEDLLQEVEKAGKEVGL